MNGSRVRPLLRQRKVILVIIVIGAIYILLRMITYGLASRQVAYVKTVDELVPTSLSDPRGSADASTDACLLIHGYAATPASFEPLVAELRAANFAVVAPWLPAHNRSPIELGRSDPSSWVESVRPYLSELRRRYRRVFVIGHSIGGTIALDLATSEPLAGVVVINPMLDLERIGPFHPEHLYGPIATVVPRFPYILSLNMSRPDMKRFAFTYSWIPTDQGRQLTAYSNVVHDRARLVTAPLLLITSTRDMVIDPSSSEAFAEGVSSEVIKRLTLPRSGHMALLDWDSEIASAGILAFMRSVH